KKVDRIEDNKEINQKNNKFYINYKQEYLSIDPHFKYGENTLNPLISGTDEQSIDASSVFIRDMYNEKDTLNVLSHYFKKAEVIEEKYVFNQFEDISTFIYDFLSEISELMEVYLSSDAKNL